MWSCHVHHGFTKVRDLAHVEVWEKSRTTCCRFLQSFALLDKKWFDPAILRETSWADCHERFARQYRPKTPRKCALVKHSSPSFRSWHVCSFSECGVCVCGVCWCVVDVFSCVCVGVRRCVCSCVCGLWCVATHSQDHGNINILMYMKTQSGTLTFHDVCFSKALTFHNGFMFFASRTCFQHFSRLQKKQCSLTSRKSAWNSYEKEKTWNHCGRSKASKSRHHGKRLRFSMINWAKKSDADMYMYIFLYK